MKKGFVSVVTLFLAAVVLAGGFYFLVYQPRQQASLSVKQNESPKVGSDRDSHGCIGSAGYSWCDIKQKCLRTWEEPCANTTPTPGMDETEIIKAAVKAAIVAKRGASANELTYTVSKVMGNYAQGGASAQGGGAMWFAAKLDGKWTLVWDGNGVILCSDIAAYPDFPVTMIPECYNDKTQKTVTR